MARRTHASLGSLPLGRAAHARTDDHRGRLSTQLAAVPVAAAQWLDPAAVAALVLGVDSLSGGAVLLLAVPRPEAIPLGLGAGGPRVRAGRIHRNQQLAGDDQRRVM